MAHLLSPLCSRGSEGRPRPLLPKGSWSSGQWLSVQHPLVLGLQYHCWSGSGFHIPTCLHQGPPMFSLCCGTCLAPEVESRLSPSGPWRRTGWACLAGPASNRGRGAPFRTKTRPVSPRPVLPHRGAMELIIYRLCILRGFLPPRNLSAPRGNPRLHF